MRWASSGVMGSVPRGGGKDEDAARNVSRWRVKKAQRFQGWRTLGIQDISVGVLLFPLWPVLCRTVTELCWPLSLSDVSKVNPTYWFLLDSKNLTSRSGALSQQLINYSLPSHQGPKVWPRLRATWTQCPPSTWRGRQRGWTLTFSPYNDVAQRLSLGDAPAFAIQICASRFSKQKTKRHTWERHLPGSSHRARRYEGGGEGRGGPHCQQEAGGHYSDLRHALALIHPCHNPAWWFDLLFFWKPMVTRK